MYLDFKNVFTNVTYEGIIPLNYIDEYWIESLLFFVKKLMLQSGQFLSFSTHFDIFRGPHF